MFQPVIMGLFLVAWFFSDGAPTADADTQAKATQARTILHLIIDGKYAEFAAAGDEKVKAVMEANVAKEIWRGLTAQAGAYKSEISCQVKKVGNVWAVDFGCQFEEGRLTLRLAVDEAGRMAGFRVLPYEENIPYKAPDYVDEAAFREHKVTVSAGKYPLDGTLTLPKGEAKHPAVVLVHGSGPHDEDETVGAAKPFRDLAWGLASQGVVVLRYEKRTYKHPTAVKAEEWTLENETIEDALAGAELLRRQPEVDAKRVFVVGHSLGAFAAPFIGQQDAKLGGIVMLAGNARSILDVVDDQMDYLLEVNAGLPANEKARLQEVKKQTAAIRAGQTEKLSVLGAPAVYWERLHKLDPVAAAGKLKMPILILQGGRDYQVTKKDFAVWQKELGNEKHKNVTLLLMDKLNHLFEAGEGMSTPDEYNRPGHVDGQVVKYVAEWIKSRGTGGSEK